MSKKKAKSHPMAAGREAAKAAAPSKRESQSRLIAANRRASFRYHLEERLEAGVALFGSEVKAIRAGRVNLTDGFVLMRDGEAWLEGVQISLLPQAAAWIPEPRRSRKLLLHKAQADKWQGRAARRGYTVVPTKMYLNDRGRVKVEIALAKGKQLSDKRETIKRRIVLREADAAMKRKRGAS